MSKIKKNQKPIEYDIHLKYKCKNCCQDHWLSFNEASTKNFKIVCYCGNVFGVKRVSKCKIIYTKSNTVNSKIIKSCLSVLLGYGYDKERSEQIIREILSASPEIKLADLIKKSLVKLGE